MIVGGEIVSFHRVLADLDQVLRFPAVAAEERDVQSELLRLNANQCGIGVITGHEHGVRRGGLDGGELRFEVLVAAVEVELHADFSAGFTETFLEILREPLAVVALHIGEHGDLLRLERFAGEVRHHRSLKRIDEAHAEDVVACFRHLWVGRGRGDHRDLALLADVRGFEGTAGGYFAEDGHYAVAVDELADHGRGFARFGKVILREQLYFLSEHAAGGIDFLHGQDRAFMGRGAKGRLFAGQRRELADLDYVAGFLVAPCAERSQQRGEREQRQPARSPRRPASVGGWVLCDRSGRTVSK